MSKIQCLSLVTSYLKDKCVKQVQSHVLGAMMRIMVGHRRANNWYYLWESGEFSLRGKLYWLKSLTLAVFIINCLRYQFRF